MMETLKILTLFAGGGIVLWVIVFVFLLVMDNLCERQENKKLERMMCDPERTRETPEQRMAAIQKQWCGYHIGKVRAAYHSELCDLLGGGDCQDIADAIMDGAQLSYMLALNEKRKQEQKQGRA